MTERYSRERANAQAAEALADDRDRLREINADLLKVAKWAASVGQGMSNAQIKEEFRDEVAHLILSARAAIAKAEGAKDE